METETFSPLRQIEKTIADKRLDVHTYIEVYLNNVLLYSSKQMCDICLSIEKYGECVDDLLLKFVVDNRYTDFPLQKEMKDKTLALLLNYHSYRNNDFLFFDATSYVAEILNKYDFLDFAIAYNEKVIHDINKYRDYRISERLYFALLPKYEEQILPTVLNELSSEESAFFEYAGRDLGSGYGFGAGPLFLCDNENLKIRCLMEANNCLPYRLANMAPVFSTSDDRAEFSDFLLWIVENIDHFAHKDKILNAINYNLENFTWIGPVLPLYEKEKKCFESLLITSKSNEVKSWCEKCITELSKVISQEQNVETYRNIVGG
jgi:hypothetical protein